MMARVYEICIDCSRVLSGWCTDSSVSKPALVQHTDYIVEKETYLDLFGDYLMHQLHIKDSKGVSIFKNNCCNVVVKSCYL